MTGNYAERIRLLRDMTIRISGLDDEALLREYTLARGAADWDDAHTLLWLACLAGERANRIEAGDPRA